MAKVNIISSICASHVSWSHEGNLRNRYKVYIQWCKNVIKFFRTHLIKWIKIKTLKKDKKCKKKMNRRI